MKKPCVKTSHGLRLGDKPFLKKGRLSPVLALLLKIMKIMWRKGRL
jgi:hypothetical protein